MQKKLLFFVNPKAGHSEIRGSLMQVIQTLTAGGYEVTVHPTSAPRDLTRQIEKRAADFDLVVCTGGDGTLNEAVSGLMQLPPSARPPLGYIPGGTVNDVARTLGLSMDPILAAQDIVTGREFPIDVGAFGENRWFVYVAAFGAFTEVSYSTPQETKNILGHQAYMLEAIKRLTGLKSYRMRLTWEHLGEQRELEEEFILGMVTNTTSIGGFKGLVGMDVALDDGEFEVLLVRKPRTPLDIASIAAYLIQREGENECVFKFRTSKLTVQSEELVDWSLDGEFGGSQTEVVIENKPREIAIRVPEVTVRG